MQKRIRGFDVLDFLNNFYHLLKAWNVSTNRNNKMKLKKQEKSKTENNKLTITERF